MLNIQPIAKYAEKYGVKSILQTKPAELSKINFGRFKLATIETDVVTFSKKSPFEKTVDGLINRLGNGPVDKKMLKEELMAFNVNEESLGKVAIDKFAEKLGFNVKPYINNVKMERGMGSCNPCYDQIDINTHPKFLSKRDIDDLRQNIKNCKGYAEDDIINAKIVQLNKEYPLPVKDIRDYSQYYIKNNERSPQIEKILTVLHEGYHMKQHCEIANAIGVSGFERFLRMFEPGFVFDKFTRNFYEANTIKQGGTVNVEKQAQRAQKLMADIEDRVDPRVDFAAYWRSPSEVEARRFEAKIMKNPLYAMLEEVFQKLNNS